MSAGFLPWVFASESKTLGCSTMMYGTSGGVSRGLSERRLCCLVIISYIFKYLHTYILYMIHLFQADWSSQRGNIKKHESALSMPSIELSPSRRSKIPLCRRTYVYFASPIEAQRLMKSRFDPSDPLHRCNESCPPCLA